MTIPSMIRMLVTVVVAGKCLRASPLPLRVSDAVTGDVRQYVVRAGDSLTALGARFGVSTELIAAANDLRSDKGLVTGQQLTIDNRHVVPVAADAQAAILINVPQRMLFTRRGNGAMDGFPDRRRQAGLADSNRTVPDHPQRGAPDVGRAGQHPGGNAPRRSTRHHTHAPRPAQSARRLLDRIELRSLGIHGTPYPSSIYRFVTHGCVRLHPEDIAAVYGEVAIGAAGVILYEPVLLAATADGTFLEAHRDAYRRGSPTIEQVRRAAGEAGLDARLDWMAAAEVLRRREGIARSVSLD